MTVFSTATRKRSVYSAAFFRSTKRFIAGNSASSTANGSTNHHSSLKLVLRPRKLYMTSYARRERIARHLYTSTGRHTENTIQKVL